jgi:hypothetical protein
VTYSRKRTSSNFTNDAFLRRECVLDDAFAAYAGRWTTNARAHHGPVRARRWHLPLVTALRRQDATLVASLLSTSATDLLSVETCSSSVSVIFTLY